MSFTIEDTKEYWNNLASTIKIETVKNLMSDLHASGIECTFIKEMRQLPSSHDRNEYTYGHVDIQISPMEEFYPILQTWLNSAEE